MKIRISTEWLSGCSGCHVAIMDLHERLAALLEDVEFVRIPVLLDEKGFPAADIGLVEGAIRSRHDRENILRLRDSVKTLIAFGTCAVYGGPSGIGWLYANQDVLERVYGTGPTNVPGQCPDGRTETLAGSVIPVDEAVPVDVYLPGCPPHPHFINATLKKLAGRDVQPLNHQTVCAACERQMKKCPGTALRPGEVTADDPDTCLLCQGVLCLGSVSLNRCLAPCPNAGVACTGCNGPSLDLITEPHLDFRTLIARRMELLCGIEPERVIKYMEAEAKTFYAYAMASSVIFGKPSLDLKEWAGQR